METKLPESPETTPFSTLQRAIAILLQNASAVEGLFTVPVSEEAASKAWASVFAKDPVEPDHNMKEMELHHLAAAILLELKRLDGSLLTNELHNRFVAAAAISNRYSQIYVFRLLLGNLPPTNYSVLKNLSLLLRCTTFRNTPKVSEQVIVTFGRLLMRHRDGVLFVHRQLTAADAGTLITVVLIEEWNYLFQYGRVSFNNSPAKVNTDPTIPTSDVRYV
ncbi:hypothetical protein MPTK1_8g08730 [Marchantia polymorpha subsp. ruderalis]|uniref:Rho-GAP domain-containing protein n=1 Tax=Marchantia polymorpha TaxID=3197 RepID=A0A2R6WRK9_MARPO|nr:hypothetical protein MARPO_0063s0046 [Marchantia polymorpha]BBN19212.1 hypothetical protein Mp_8g08730 [Marchantia polymorpha subsp. ruderalis]|eukprot:PTQ36500.1 hypothetical protein MARPO_0063s0046 [Marchantia polymorpha]